MERVRMDSPLSGGRGDFAHGLLGLVGRPVFRHGLDRRRRMGGAAKALCAIGRPDGVHLGPPAGKAADVDQLRQVLLRRRGPHLFYRSGGGDRVGHPGNQGLV